MKDTLEQLRGRSKEEKTAIAASIAIGVVAILFIGWAIYFFHTLAASADTPVQTATSSSSGTNGLEPTGTTTQFIQSSQGTIQLEQIGTSTGSTQ